MSDVDDRGGLETRARRLEFATIGWNVLESAVSISLGIAAGSLALIGFGIDSVVEIFASLVVVWHLGAGTSDANHSARTRIALRLTSVAFLLLAVGLSVAAISDLVSGRQADESILGIVYLAITVLVMFGLAFAKRKVADRLDSAPLRAESAMSMLDGFLAAATLGGLVLNAFLEWWWADPAAALVIAVVAVGEAKENWEEAGEA